MTEHAETDWEAIYEAERFRIPTRQLSPDVTRHFAWEGWSPDHKIPNQWLEHYARAFHFTDAEILAGRTARPMPVAGGVYFLFDGERCIYIGMTKCFRDRSEQHWESGKRWTSHAYIEVPIMHAEAVEAYYIRRFDPPLNNKYPLHRSYSDLVTKLRLGDDARVERRPRVVVISARPPPPIPERRLARHRPAAAPRP